MLERSVGNTRRSIYGQLEMTTINTLVVKRSKDSRVFYLEKARKENYTQVSLIMCTKSGRRLMVTTASKPFARHIVVSAQAVQPSVEASSETPSGTIVKHNNPPRQCYPKEVLKHRFMPYGSVNGLEGDLTVEQETESMDVDTPEVPFAISFSPTKAVKEAPPSSPKEAKKVKGKKRKGDGEAPTAKKSKKAKTS